MNLKKPWESLPLKNIRMQQVKSINQTYYQLETLGRKDGVVYLKRVFAGRNDILLSTIDLINRPTIVISEGRSSDKIAEPSAVGGE